jgi:hypothetical protein
MIKSSHFVLLFPLLIRVLIFGHFPFVRPLWKSRTSQTCSSEWVTIDLRVFENPQNKLRSLSQRLQFGEDCAHVHEMCQWTRTNLMTGSRHFFTPTVLIASSKWRAIVQFLLGFSSQPGKARFLFLPRRNKIRNPRKLRSKIQRRNQLFEICS